MTDLSTWLTTAEVCARLGVSESTLDRECRKGLWHPAERPRAGKRPERVFSPQEVALREKPAQEMVRHEPATLPAIPAKASPAPGLTQWDAAWHVIAPRLLEAMVAQKPATPALFVSLKEASEITGLRVGYLKLLIATGHLPANAGGPHGAIRVRRGDLTMLNLGDGQPEKAGA